MVERPLGERSTVPTTSTGKLRAFLIHLGISASVVGAAVLVIFFFWYPPPYFQVIGTWLALRVLIGVDLVLGPTLTLILFRAGKPRLLVDMAVIVVIQLSALIYGLTVIYQERPYAAVFVVDRFEIMTRDEIDLTRATAELQHKPARGPILAVALVPDDPQERMALIEEVLAGKPDLEQRPEHWITYSDGLEVVLSRAKPLSALLPAPNPNDTAQAKRLMARYAGRSATVVFVPVMGKAGPGILLLDNATGRPVDAAAIHPWPPAPPRAAQLPAT